jgi:hypothetical protein
VAGKAGIHDTPELRPNRVPKPPTYLLVLRVVLVALDDARLCGLEVTGTMRFVRVSNEHQILPTVHAA